MANSKGTTLIIGDKHPITLGSFPHLYEASAYKASKEEAEKSQEKATSPTFSIKVSFDKDNKGDMANVDILQDTIDKVMEDAGWSARMRDRASRFLLDGDEDMVTKSIGSDEVVLLAEKYPELKNHYSMNAKNSMRPDVKYVNPETGTIERMPMPKLHPVGEKEEQEAQEIKDMWREWVYWGQKVALVLNVRTYMIGSSTFGVRAKLDGVVLLGGGEHLGKSNIDNVLTEQVTGNLVALAQQLNGGVQEEAESKRAKRRTPEDEFMEEDDIF